MSKLSRRTLVTSASALPALAVPALATSVAASPSAPDPIFAAIETHRRLHAQWLKCVEHEFGIEGQFPIEKRRSSSLTIVETDDPRWIAAKLDTENAAEGKVLAAWELTTTRPTTAAGAVALLRYYAQAVNSDSEIFPVDESESDTYFASLIALNAADALEAQS